MSWTAGLAAVLAGALLTYNAAAVTAALRTIPARLDDVAIAAGLGIEQVSVSGHRFTADSDVFDSLDLANVRTMTALDSRRVQARIERLPWVATATVSRIYPARIDIALTERRPFAVWLNGQSSSLVDETGRILSAVPASYARALVRLSGEGAPGSARALFEMLAHYPEIAARLKQATRVIGRRWSLELSDGVRLELPSEGEATALAALAAGDAGRQLLGRRDTVIDLRSRREIAVRASGAP
jgi:cell division protein FtsQ